MAQFRETPMLAYILHECVPHAASTGNLTDVVKIESSTISVDRVVRGGPKLLLRPTHTDGQGKDRCTSFFDKQQFGTLDQRETKPMMLSILAMLLVTLSSQAPAGWEDASRRAALLIADGKAVQAIALLERTVVQAPGVEGLEYELARAHQWRAGELADESHAQDSTRRRHLERAALYYKQVAARKGQYRQLALARLLTVYGEEELDLPAERAKAAREYIVVESRSAVGHVVLGAALRRTGQDAAAWSALEAACTAVRPADAPALARAILMHLTEAPFATGQPGGNSAPRPVAPKELASLLDYSDRALDRELAGPTHERGAILAKAASLTLRAQWLERDPARRKALEAEADALLARNRTSNGGKPAPETTADKSTPLPSLPAGLDEAWKQADALAARKQYTEAAAIYERFMTSHPAFAPAHYLRVGVLIRAGQTASVESALRHAREAIPPTFESRYLGATHLEEMVRKNATIDTAAATRVLGEALELLDEALELKPNDVGALTYKSLVVRGQARFASDPAVVRKLTAEADRLIAAAQAARKR